MARRRSGRRFRTIQRSDGLSCGERPIDGPASGDARRFWDRVLKNLKSHLETEIAPPSKPS
jgi:hypothetical protein